MTEENAKVVKKLTVKQVVGNVRKGDYPKDGKDKLPLLYVYGQANSAAPASADIGDYIQYKGAFEAVAAYGKEKGKFTRAPVLVVPAAAQAIIDGLMTSDGVLAVNFGLEIGLEKTDTSLGYRHYAIPIMEADQTDPLGALREKLTKSRAAAYLFAPEDALAGNPDQGPKGDGAGTSRKKGVQS